MGDLTHARDRRQRFAALGCEGRWCGSIPGAVFRCTRSCAGGWSRMARSGAIECRIVFDPNRVVRIVCEWQDVFDVAAIALGDANDGKAVQYADAERGVSCANRRAILHPGTHARCPRRLRPCARLRGRRQGHDGSLARLIQARQGFGGVSAVRFARTKRGGRRARMQMKLILSLTLCWFMSSGCDSDFGSKTSGQACTRSAQCAKGLRCQEGLCHAKHRPAPIEPDASEADAEAAPDAAPPPEPVEGK
jgi:hypothetical protein